MFIFVFDVFECRGVDEAVVEGDIFYIVRYVVECTLRIGIVTNSMFSLLLFFILMFFLAFERRKYVEGGSSIQVVGLSCVYTIFLEINPIGYGWNNGTSSPLRTGWRMRLWVQDHWVCRDLTIEIR